MRATIMVNVSKMRPYVSKDALEKENSFLSEQADNVSPFVLFRRSQKEVFRTRRRKPHEKRRTKVGSGAEGKRLGAERAKLTLIQNLPPSLFVAEAKSFSFPWQRFHRQFAVADRDYPDHEDNDLICDMEGQNPIQNKDGAPEAGQSESPTVPSVPTNSTRRPSHLIDMELYEGVSVLLGARDRRGRQYPSGDVWRQ